MRISTIWIMQQLRLRMLTLLIVICAISGLFPQYSIAELAKISWEELPNHLDQKSVVVRQFNVADCPADIADLTSPKTVAQVIENTFYLWDEYDIDGPESNVFCIVMKKPEEKALSADEARILLTASSLWRAPIQTSSQNNEPVAQEEGIVNNLIVPAGASTGMTRIENTDTYPYNTVANLKYYIQNRNYNATGFLVGPHTILTSAMAVYLPSYASWIEAMIISPGQNQSSSYGPFTRPYGTRTGAFFHADLDYINSPGYSNRDNYGAVNFIEPFSGISTYMPLEFSTNLPVGAIVHLAGYPKYDNRSYGGAMSSNSGSIVSVSSFFIDYSMITESGNIGAPIWYEPAPNDPRVVGIHLSNQYNSATSYGVRLTPENQALITEWMQWEPPVGGDNYEPNNTSGEAYDLSGHDNTWLSGLLGAPVETDDDWYMIYVTPGYEHLKIDCRFSHFSGNVDITLYDSNILPVASSASTDDNELIELLLPNPGIYYVEVTSENLGGSYDLLWDDILVPTPPLAPTGLDARTGSIGEIILTWDAADTTDGYRVFYDEDPNNPPFIPSEEGSPESGADIGNDTEVIIRDLEPGATYHLALKSYNYGGVGDYSTIVTAMAGTELLDDSYEPNNSMAEAFYMRYNARLWLSEIDGLGVQSDDDWYEISLPSNYERIIVDCRFTHEEGDIDIALYNSYGVSVASSSTINDNEYIDYSVLGGDIYYIRVYYGNAGNSYDLMWDYENLPYGPRISGTVYSTETGSPMRNVSVVFSGLGSINTDNYGEYEKQVAYGWTGIVTPVLDGWTFDPPYRNYSNITEHTGNKNYSGNPPPPPEISALELDENGCCVIKWNSDANAKYSIWYKEDINETGTWTRLNNNAVNASSSGTTQYIDTRYDMRDPSAPSRGFFKVERWY